MATGQANSAALYKQCIYYIVTVRSACTVVICEVLVNSLFLQKSEGGWPVQCIFVPFSASVDLPAFEACLFV